MDNHLIVDKIATYLTHNDLKSTRLLNNFWNTQLTRELKTRKTTRVLINRNTLSPLMNSDSDISDSVQLDWSFGDSIPVSEHETIARFFLEYGKTIKTLDWTGADFLDKDHKGRLWNTKLTFEERTKLVLGFNNNLGRQLGEFLYLMPNLTELSLGKIDGGSYAGRCNICKPISDALFFMSKFHLKNLTTLTFGSQTFLSVHDMEVLTSLGLQMKQFTFTGKEISWRSGFPIESLLNSWNSTLEFLYLRSTPNFKLGVMSVLKTFRVETSFKLLNPLPLVQQFPALEFLSLTLHTEFDWEAFTPIDMPNHPKLITLRIFERPFNAINNPYFINLLSKCPNLKNLSTGKVNDRVAVAIFEHLNKLEHLTMSAAFSPSTLTGIPSEILEALLLKAIDEIGFENPLTTSVSVLKLTNLRVLEITGSSAVGAMNDISVLYGISNLKNLRKLTLPEGISNKSLERLASHLNLIELTIPPPDKGLELTKEGIDLLKSRKPNLKINVAKYDHFLCKFVSHPLH